MNESLIESKFNKMVKMLFDLEYITPMDMSIILGCNYSELKHLLEYHKNITGSYGIYGNCNTMVFYNDKVTLQGWKNFLKMYPSEVNDKVIRCIDNWVLFS